MSLWRRIVVLVVMASVMAFMSAPAAWAGGYGDKDDDKDKKVCVKHYKGNGEYKYLYISYEGWKNGHKDHDKDKKVDDKYCDKKDDDKDDDDDGKKDYKDDKDEEHYS
jgi:hypothetical protein